MISMNQKIIDGSQEGGYNVVDVYKEFDSYRHDPNIWGNPLLFFKITDTILNPADHNSQALDPYLTDKGHELIYNAYLLPVESITLDKTSTDLLQYTTLELNSTIEPINVIDTTVAWSSSDEAIATVDSHGIVTAKVPGRATITVTTNSGTKTANCIINVIKASKKYIALGD